jgi:hypothetical protein
MTRFGDRLNSIGLALASKMHIVIGNAMSGKDIYRFLQLSFKKMEIPMGFYFFRASFPVWKLLKIARSTLIINQAKSPTALALIQPYKS